MEDYQTELIHHILAEDFMDTNEQIINQVDSVTQLLSDILQDFVRVEIDLASQKYDACPLTHFINNSRIGGS